MDPYLSAHASNDEELEAMLDRFEVRVCFCIRPTTTMSIKHTLTHSHPTNRCNAVAVAPVP